MLRALNRDNPLAIEEYCYDFAESGIFCLQDNDGRCVCLIQITKFFQLHGCCSSCVEA